MNNRLLFLFLFLFAATVAAGQTVVGSGRQSDRPARKSGGICQYRIVFVARLGLRDGCGEWCGW